MYVFAAHGLRNQQRPVFMHPDDYCVKVRWLLAGMEQVGTRTSFNACCGPCIEGESSPLLSLVRTYSLCMMCVCVHVSMCSSSCVLLQTEYTRRIVRAGTPTYAYMGYRDNKSTIVCSALEEVSAETVKRL